MTTKQIRELLLSVNSTNDLGFKYPIGNRELTLKLKELEISGKIKYLDHYGKWQIQSTKVG